MLSQPATSTVSFAPIILPTSDPYCSTFYYYILPYSADGKIDRTTKEEPNTDSPPYAKFTVEVGNIKIAEGFLEQKLGNDVWYPKCVNMPIATMEEIKIVITGYNIYVAVDDISLNSGSCSGTFYFDFTNVKHNIKFIWAYKYIGGSRGGTWGLDPT